MTVATVDKALLASLAQRRPLVVALVLATGAFAGIVAGSTAPPASIMWLVLFVVLAAAAIRPDIAFLGMVAMAFLLPFAIVPIRLGVQPPIFELGLAATVASALLRSRPFANGPPKLSLANPHFWVTGFLMAGLVSTAISLSRSWDVQQLQYAAKLGLGVTAFYLAANWSRRRGFARKLTFVIATAGALQAVLATAMSGEGDHIWSADTGIPTSSMAVAPNGGALATFGFDIVLLDSAGRPVWQRPFRPDNQLIEEVRLTSTGFVVVRTTNISGTGHVFAYTPDGLFWGPTQDYIGAVSLEVSLDSNLVAVGSTKDGVSQVVLIERSGNLAQRFGVNGEIRRILFSRNAGHTVVHSANGLVVYNNERGDFFADIPFPADFIARGAQDDTIFAASPRGVAAYSLAGSQLWFNDGVAPRSLVASKSFLCGVSSDTSVSVLRTNGEYVGEATTLTSIRAIALAPETDVLAIASAERNVLAWQLPA